MGDKTSNNEEISGNNDTGWNSNNNLWYCMKITKRVNIFYFVHIKYIPWQTFNRYKKTASRKT